MTASTLTPAHLYKLSRVLIGLSDCHRQGEMYVPVSAVAPRAKMMHSDTGDLLKDAKERGWVTEGRTLHTYRIVDRVVISFTVGMHNCDPCFYDDKLSTRAIADCRTPQGWGYVCAEHFIRLGCGLGEGRGQFLRMEY